MQGPPAGHAGNQAQRLNGAPHVGVPCRFVHGPLVDALDGAARDARDQPAHEHPVLKLRQQGGEALRDSRRDMSVVART